MTSSRVELDPFLAETGRPTMATISSARPSWQRGPVFKFFSSLKLAVVLLAVLIVAAIAGTIWESSFDAKVARAYVYRAPWFNLWLVLLGANLAVSAFSRWPWRKHHLAFHNASRHHHPADWIAHRSDFWNRRNHDALQRGGANESSPYQSTPVARARCRWNR